MHCSFDASPWEVAVWGVPCMVLWLGLDAFTVMAWVQALVWEVIPQAISCSQKKKKCCNLEAGQHLLEFWIWIALAGGRALTRRTTLIFSLFPLHNLLGFWLHLSLNPCVDKIWAVSAGTEEKLKCQPQSGHFLRMPGNLDQIHGVRNEVKYDRCNKEALVCILEYRVRKTLRVMIPRSKCWLCRPFWACGHFLLPVYRRSYLGRAAPYWSIWWERVLKNNS